MLTRRAKAYSSSCLQIYHYEQQSITPFIPLKFRLSENNNSSDR